MLFIANFVQRLYGLHLFLQKFIANDNSICKQFSKQAEINLKKLFSDYDNVSLISELRMVVENLHFAR